VKIRKTVTEKKRMANRGNAKKSHGPRTERGKKHSRFNAIKGGLFAKFLVLWQVDGEDSDEEFAKLYANLKLEYRPEGPTENYYLEEMAKSMWRIRRATRYEQGSLRKETRSWDPQKPKIGWVVAAPATAKLEILENALEEIETTGTLSLAGYQEVLSLLTDDDQEAPPILTLGSGDMAQSEEGISPAKPNIDKQFLASLNDEVKSQQWKVRCDTSLGDQQVEDYFADRILPGRCEMEHIFGCEKTAHNQFDWALRGLLESKDRRKKGKKPSTI
jgi:hypothetical protein